MIPNFRNTTEEAIWAQFYARHISGGATEAWKLADRGLEDWRDEEQRRRIDERIPSEEGPAHVYVRRLLTEWVAVRHTQPDGFHVTIGRIRASQSGWIAYDDRHGPRRVSLHGDAESAIAAVRLRASKSEEELDRETASIVDLLREIRHLKAELEEQPKADRVAEILARANEIGRLWA